MGLAVGMVVDDRYLLEAQIGSGGMARVFRAQNRKNGKRVALKELFIPAGDADDTLRGWFKREIKALMVLDHPNVLQLIDHGETDGFPWVVTELLEGKDLDDSVRSRGVLPSSVVVDVATQALGAFTSAHQHSIVHRDIKPANIFLCESGRVVVLDFGLARATTLDVGLTMAQGFETKILGTPQYWSPEQIKGVTLSPASDMFSFGGTLYFLLSGAAPYKGGTPFEIASQIMAKKRQPLLAVAPECDPRLAQLVEGMLEEEGLDRPTARQALAAFEDLARLFPNHHTDLLRYVAGEAEHMQTSIITGIAALVPTPTVIGKMPVREPVQEARSVRLPLVVALFALLVLAAVALLWLTSAPVSQSPPAITAIAPPPPREERAELPMPAPQPTEIPVVPKQQEDPSPQPRPDSSKSTGPGTLSCQLKQWAEVFVDGLPIGRKQVGIKLNLAAGKHELVFRNTKLGERRATFVIKPGKETTCRIDFEDD